ncbi:hypothetical protein K491DRAFT_758383 [Lophiostoma macrostomum CBS 122681]|uniref:Uncharacterized protein n=1 Tax=Lophiostoma macrostomum CBS 122681 TaxID=1314788 RepID=A0A6A6T593_9PLEO|nr:hypothetical protein K491DRAFT_758383 [Lophiostoma macrostomum CBS 122681]
MPALHFAPTSIMATLHAVNGSANSSVSLSVFQDQSSASLIRPTQSLSYEIANHAKAYLEANQYATGYAFLSTLLTTGVVASTEAQRYPALLAPAPQLAFAVSLIAYPPITTKAQSSNKVAGADAALRYLQNVQNTISPLDAIRRKAFVFPDERTRRRTMAQRQSASLSPGTPGRLDLLGGIAANGQSIWYRATDFWHIVGWAFNCSASHKKRWERWKLWLEVMLDYLEAEFEARVHLCNEAGTKSEEILMESLLWHYISSEPPESRTTRLRIIRAVLAMDTSHSGSSYPEIWEDETLEPTAPDKDTFLHEIDIENGQLGDFGRDDEDVVMQNAPSTTRSGTKSRPRGRRSVPTETQGNDEDIIEIGSVGEAVDRLGGIEALQLRRRLLTLLSRVAQMLPRQFTSLEDLVEVLAEELVRLPTMFLSPIVSMVALPEPLQIALNADLLRPLVKGELPDYISIRPTQSHMEDYFLPRRATAESYATNAKISLIVEQMFMYMMNAQALEATDRLRKAVENGCEARGSLYGTGRKKRGNATEESHAKFVLQSSTERLLGLLEVLEISKGKPPQPRQDTGRSMSLSFNSDLSSPPESDIEEEEDEE